MVRKLNSIVLAGALLMVASPVFADDFLAPIFAPITSIDLAPVAAPIASMDLDPFHILTPTPAPAAAPAPAPVKKKHHLKHHMKKK